MNRQNDLEGDFSSIFYAIVQDFPGKKLRETANK
jgi:hypothetical protein